MPTIFDASAEEKKKKQKAVEEQLAQIQEESRHKKTVHKPDLVADTETLPIQEEADLTFSLSDQQALAKEKESLFEDPSPVEVPTLDSSDISDEPEFDISGDEDAKSDTIAQARKKSTKSEKTEVNAQKTESAPKTHKRRLASEYSSVLREEKPNNGIFAAFMPQPVGVGFESQHENEEILLVLRQHPVVNVVWITITLVLVMAPFLLFPLIPLQLILPGVYMFFLMIAWYLFVTAYIIESFLGWYFNIYIITDERIIDIDFYSLIYKSVSEAKIEKIEDVTSTTAGFFGAFFNFGNIAIQTAAEKREFEFARVPQPAKISKFLNELILEEEREKIEGRVI